MRCGDVAAQRFRALIVALNSPFWAILGRALVLQSQSDVSEAFTKLSIVSLVLLNFASCGGAESNSSRSVAQFQTNDGGKLYLANVSPVTLAFDRSSQDPNIIEPVSRKLTPLQMEVLVEPELSQDQKMALSFVTGIGVEAVFKVQPIGGEMQTIQLPVRMGLRARRWDPKTETFGSETQVFMAQGMNLDGAQEFAITDPKNPNFVFTGLGMLLREGQFKKLELRRSTLSDLYDSGSDMGGLSASNQVLLPAGWVAVGLIIAVDKANATQPPREPFVSDIVFYSALLTRTVGP